MKDPKKAKWIVGNNKVDIHTADSDFTEIATFFSNDIAEHVVKLHNESLKNEDIVARLEEDADKVRNELHMAACQLDHPLVKE